MTELQIFLKEAMASVVKHQVIIFILLRLSVLKSNCLSNLNKVELKEIGPGYLPWKCSERFISPWIRGEGALTWTNAAGVRQFNVVLLGNLVAGGLTSPGVNKYEATLTAYMPGTFTIYLFVPPSTFPSIPERGWGCTEVRCGVNGRPANWPSVVIVRSNWIYGARRRMPQAPLGQCN